MKKIKQCIVGGLSACMLLTACSQKDIIIGNFESGNFEGWTTAGEAFGTKPASGALSGQATVEGFEGTYFINGYANGRATGTITSQEFIIERNYINFLLGGSADKTSYIELLIDGKSVLKTLPVEESFSLQPFSWNVKAYKGQKAQIRIADEQTEPWGYLMADQLVQSDKMAESVYIYDKNIQFAITKKYILFPAENNAPAYTIHFETDGKDAFFPLDIPLAQNRIDYWTPVDVSKFAGKEMVLRFKHVKKDDMGLSQIKQEDTFEYDYNEKYRPLFHFSPPFGWTNDPNGQIFYDGQYHLYYQHNPYAMTWGNMSWGHAVSKDLMHWEHLPVAIPRDKDGFIFSGCTVLDRNNTAGFGENTLLAIYTATAEAQTQYLAYSRDGGKTFTNYENNPVLADPNIQDFRDPNVFWHEPSKQWVMALATAQTISFYGSPDLKQWTKLSAFGEGIGNHNGTWECPNLFTLPYNGQSKWVLLVSINPGSPNGGSVTQYFIGEFDGKTFHADKLPYPLYLDYGCDNYAGITWGNQPDGKRIFIGWMSNWNYTKQTPAMYFRNAMTVPRELQLVGNGQHLLVASKPIELDKTETYQSGLIQEKKDFRIEQLLKDNKGAYQIDIEVSAMDLFSLKLFNALNEEIIFTFDTKAKILNIDRSRSGIVDFHPSFAGKAIKAPLPVSKRYKIKLLVDKASIECFVNDGILVSTNTVFPNEPYNSLAVESGSGAVNVENITVYEINTKKQE